MATTVINIRNVEWSKNPAAVGEAILLKVTVNKTITDTVQSSSNIFSGQISSGEQVNSEFAFKP